MARRLRYGRGAGRSRELREERRGRARCVRVAGGARSLPLHHPRSLASRGSCRPPSKLIETAPAFLPPRIRVMKARSSEASSRRSVGAPHKRFGATFAGRPKESPMRRYACLAFALLVALPASVRADMCGEHRLAIDAYVAATDTRDAIDEALEAARNGTRAARASRRAIKALTEEAVHDIVEAAGASDSLGAAEAAGAALGEAFETVYAGSGKPPPSSRARTPPPSRRPASKQTMPPKRSSIRSRGSRRWPDGRPSRPPPQRPGPHRAPRPPRPSSPRTRTSSEPPASRSPRALRSGDCLDRDRNLPAFASASRRCASPFPPITADSRIRSV